MSEPKRRIYLLDPQKLSPETIAVAFAKTSRSPAAFNVIANELNEERTAQFNEKWVVGYGHASVAEHAILHIAIENVSRLAAETIEGNRLASFTEKSTRYQPWNSEAFFTPEEISGSTLGKKYRETIKTLFQCYQAWQPVLERQLKHERSSGKGNRRGDEMNRLRSATLDIARYLLPAAALANLGMTVNARELEHALCKMLSSPLEEVRQIGKDIQKVAMTSIPTLIKYAAPKSYLSFQPPVFRQQDPEQNPCDWLTLVNYDDHGLERTLATWLYERSSQDYQQCLRFIQALSDDQKADLLNQTTTGMCEHDNLSRAFEHASFTFDVRMDQGAYYEVKRHRMMTQNVQALGCHLGHATPALFQRSGLAEEYRKIMIEAADCWKAMADWKPEASSYVVPNGYNRRLLLTMNLREAHQFIRLRSGARAHFAVRRVARRMAEEIVKVQPLLSGLFQSIEGETWQSIEKDHFEDLQA